MSTEAQTRAWVEIDGDALRRNYERVRDMAGATAGILPVVKTNAYGLGFEQVVRALEPFEPWGYGIATVSEGQALRSLDVDRPALLLSPLPPGEVEAAVRLSLRPCVSSIEELKRIEGAAVAAGGDVAVHVEIDTGMGRAGFPAERVDEWGPRVDACTRGRVRWEGVFTHFHSASVPHPDTVPEQEARFRAAVERLRSHRSEGWIEHLCNSGGLLRRPDFARDLVRPGIFVYGGRSGEDLPSPHRVVALRAPVVLVRAVEEGTTLGYGATYAARRRERWATVAIGYGDGLPRGLGNRGSALLAGRRVPIVGRISMGMTVVDITDLHEEATTEAGTTVTFLGEDGDAAIELSEIGALVGRTAYELLTGLPAHLPRIWV